MSQVLTRRQAIRAAAIAALAANPLRNLFAEDVSILPPVSIQSLGTGMAKVEPFVQPRMNWSSAELNDFLAELPPQGLLSLKKSLGLVKPDATTDLLLGHDQDIAEIQKSFLWVSTNILEYPLSDKTRICYHETVKWAAQSSGVDQWIIDTQPTFLIERAYIEHVFASLWDKLTFSQRQELLGKIDTLGSLKDKAAIASLSGSGALAALATTVYFAGFTFYTTMSVTLCAVAGWFGVTLPFAAYISASSLVVFLSGPFGWALITVALAAGIALAGRANLQKTVAAISQLHVLKVAALKDAGKSEDLFQVLGDPLKRQLVGKWNWGTVTFDLQSDGSFTAKNKPANLPDWKNPERWITSGKGTWSVRDGKLTIAMTQVWAMVLWKDHPETWIDDALIVKVTPTTVELDSGDTMTRE